MKRQLTRIAALVLYLLIASVNLNAQETAVFNYTVEIELTSDQGDMPTKEYLKNYGVKGIKRGPEYVYKVVNPFLISQLEKSGMDLLPLDTLSSVKSNRYGFPSANLSKAVATEVADQYLRIHLKDISSLSLDGSNQTDPLEQQKKIVKMRCRIQVYSSDKNLIQDVEGVFHTGDKIDNAGELGIDFRRVSGTIHDQELKVYETCAKMAIYKAVQALMEK